MTILFVSLIVIACVALGFIVLVQNPKGGGLNGSVGGFSNQLMGVKQTTDVLEKGTWLFAGIIVVLSIFSTLILKSSNTSKGPDTSIIQKVNTNQAPATTPANTVPAQPQQPATK
ncbi:MAG: preprotein translocase subunit SecG [Bacteroidetes bacterium]|nr:preprotein translocase subunit SecG [Bacteroidota bacterium]MBS1650169.1 preprotein translocase subunit SecG [Bacteroidota bacterium]